jgi:predicted ATPase
LDEARAEAGGMAALEARGVESESRLPYASLYQLLRRALGALERIPRAQAAALESALGLREDAAPDLYRVPLAVLTLLAEVAEEGPLLCIVDDAQWIDHDSERALVFAARRLHAEGVAMLFAAREREFQPGVLPELRLRPLDDVAVRELLADRSGTAVTQDVAHRVAAATGGNALAVAELASLLTPAQLAAREPCRCRCRCRRVWSAFSPSVCARLRRARSSWWWSPPRTIRQSRRSCSARRNA